MNQSKDVRDLEQEREDLLRLIHQNISPEVEASISYMVSLMPEPQFPQVRISSGGAQDADQG